MSGVAGRVLAQPGLFAREVEFFSQLPLQVSL